MFKEAIFLLLIILTLQAKCNGTTGNYLSEHSLGKQDEINDTTLAICPTIQLANITVTYDGATMKLHNPTLGCIFYDGSQTGKAGS